MDLPASWKHLDPLQRQQFLRFLVPDELVFENGVGGIGETLSGVRGILDLIEGEMHLAAPRQFSWNQLVEWKSLVTSLPCC